GPDHLDGALGSRDRPRRIRHGSAQGPVLAGPNHRGHEGDDRVGTRTDAALAQVVAARADLGEQVDRLEAAGRAAVDVPAKVRANPAKAAGIAAGGAFLAAGGPKRLFRRAKRAVTGKDEHLPSELLPKD